MNLAKIEWTDLQTEQETRERTIDVSLCGCRVRTSKPSLSGTRISLRITHRGESSAAIGKVACGLRNGEIGIAFTRVEENDQLILEKWITELRNERHHSMCRIAVLWPDSLGVYPAFPQAGAEWSYLEG